jgi:hypothetical protein
VLTGIVDVTVSMVVAGEQVTPARSQAREANNCPPTLNCSTFRITSTNTEVTVMKKAFASLVAVLVLSSTAFAADKYKLDVKAPSSAKKGEKATTKLHLEGAGGFHVNIDYPTKLTVTAPSGVKVEKASQTGKDAVKFAKEGADFHIDFTASETGKKSFTGEFKFASCTTDACAPATEKIAFEVEVK